jgi:hypothetical protein
MRRVSVLALATISLSACGEDKGPARADARVHDAAVDAPREPDARSRDATTLKTDARHEAGRAPGDATAPRDARAPRDAERDVRPHDAFAHDGAKDALGDGATTLTLSLPLTPAFATSVYDYYVRCPASENPVEVKMTAAPGSTIALVQPVSTPPATDATVPLTVAAGAAIVAAVTTGATTTEYWVRCLPPDFPQLVMTHHPEAGTPTPGYYLVGTVTAPDGGSAYAIVLDGEGVPVWFYTEEGSLGMYDVDNLLAGTISFDPFVVPRSGPVDEHFELHDLVSSVTSDVMAKGEPLDIHELRVLPDGGGYLVLVDPLMTGVDLTGLAGYGADASVNGCEIEQISPTGSLVWQWNASDHFDPVKDTTFPSAITSNAGTVVDAFHCNSIDVDPSGNLLVSARNMDTVFLVSRQPGTLGTVVWKMGGATYTKDDATYLAVEGDPQGQFHREHDARFQGPGLISMFDDETGLRGPMRAVLYAYDTASATATLVWQYEGRGISNDMGSFRILSDGSRVIDWGASGIGTPTFTEVDDAGNDLLDFGFAGENFSYRTVKVPTSAFDIGVLRSSTGVGDGGI